MNPSTDIDALRQRYAAELASAVEDEELVWAGVWQRDYRENIRGIPILPITPRHLVILSIAQSPFLSGDPPDACDCLAFLWALSAEYHPRGRWRRALFIHRHTRRMKTEWPLFVKDIYEMLEETFRDAPPSPIKTSRSPKSFDECVQWLDMLCPKYGGIEDILDMPFKRIFQLIKPIMAATVGMPITRPSDRIRAAFRHEMNLANAKN